MMSCVAMVIADKDECMGEDPPCSDGTYCENTPGSYICKGELYQRRLVYRNPISCGAD